MASPGGVWGCVFAEVLGSPSKVKWRNRRLSELTPGGTNLCEKSNIWLGVHQQKVQHKLEVKLQRRRSRLEQLKGLPERGEPTAVEGLLRLSAALPSDRRPRRGDEQASQNRQTQSQNRQTQDGVVALSPSLCFNSMPCSPCELSASASFCSAACLVFQSAFGLISV